MDVTGAVMARYRNQPAGEVTRVTFLVMKSLMLDCERPDARRHRLGVDRRDRRNTTINFGAGEIVSALVGDQLAAPAVTSGNAC